MNFKKKIIRLFYSCDGLKWVLLNPEDLLKSARLKSFRSLGDMLSGRKKKARLTIINDVNQTHPRPLLVSIIMPVLNSEETIPKAIKSIQMQSYPHWELLIIDDGSTDHTLSKIVKLAEQDRRIKIYKIVENKGVAYARNIGLFYAKGDFVTFHDADDTSHPDRLEYQLATLLQKPHCCVVIFQTVRVDNKGNPFVINGRKKWNRVSGMMFKRSVFDTVGFFKPLKISEDSEYYERIIATYGKNASQVLCKTLYYALFSPNSLLFTNAKVVINKQSIHYEINKEDKQFLEQYRAEHRLIAIRKHSPFHGFELDHKQIERIK